MTLDIERHLQDSNAELDFTRALRRQLVDSLTKGGTEFPKHSESVSALAGVLKDIDAQALSLAKLKVDKGAADQQAQAAALIAAVIAQGNVKSIGRVDNPEQRAAPVLEDIMQVSLNPGEMAIGNTTLDYEQFMAQVRENRT